jgi:twinkle protein
MQPTSIGFDLPYPLLNSKVEGLRKGELTLLTAGSGIGKSTLARELGYHLRSAHNLSIGNMFLEEPLEKTIQGYIAIDRDIPLSQLRKNPSLLTTKEWQESYDKLISSKWFGFKHFGSLATEDLMDKMRHLAYGEGCDFIILDHLSMVFSGQKNDNERMAIDNALTELAAFINESGVGVICVVHLSRNKTKGSFNEGASISLNDLRGSGALEQLSWNVWGLERDQQSEGEENVSRIRVLKCREIGYTGVADVCNYSFTTGRLLPTTVDVIGNY